MAELIKINIRKEKLDSMFSSLPLVTKKATANSLNKVGRLTNKEVRKHILGTYNIKADSLKIGGRNVSFKKADARRNRGIFSIFIKKRGRGLFLYNAVQLKTGVQVKVKKTPTFRRGAFISIWRKGQSDKFVFRRKESLGYYYKGKSKRQKRESLFGASVANMYNSRKSRRIIDDVIDRDYERILGEEFQKQFKGR